MKIVFRLLSFLSAYRWQAAFAILLGCIMIASNMALLGMAAYLIALPVSREPVRATWNAWFRMM
jgi:hypothetical protein